MENQQANDLFSIKLNGKGILSLRQLLWITIPLIILMAVNSCCSIIMSISSHVKYSSQMMRMYGSEHSWLRFEYKLLPWLNYVDFVFLVINLVYYALFIRQVSAGVRLNDEEMFNSSFRKLYISAVAAVCGLLLSILAYVVIMHNRFLLDH